MKIDVEYLEYLWPMRHYLITCGDLLAGTANIIACSIGHGTYSSAVRHELKTGDSK